MKKLKLTAFQLGNSEILTRQQLRNVLGGDASSSTTTTTTTKLQSQPYDCSMQQCWVSPHYYACSTDTRPGRSGCVCWSPDSGCN